MILQDINDTLEAFLGEVTNSVEPKFVVSYADVTTTAFTPGQENGDFNGTTDVTLLSAPAASTQRQIRVIHIYNADDVNHTVTIQLDDNATEVPLRKETIVPGQSMTWSKENGWSTGVISASAVKILYESNADTNAFTDADEAIVDDAVIQADFDANTILAANSDNTPLPLTIAEQRIVGRITSGNIIGLTAAEIRTLINVEDGADVTDTANVNAAAATVVGTIVTGVWNGTDIAVPDGGTGVGTLTDHGILLGSGTSAITPTAVMSDGELLVGASASDPLPKAVSGDATLAATGALTVAADAITYAKMQNVVADDVILGNVGGAGGIVDELTATEVRTLINVEDGATAGGTTFDDLTDTDISAPAGGHLPFWDGSDSWDNKVVSGDLTAASTGAMTIAADAVTYAKMQNVVADDRILGNVGGAGGIVDELTAAEVLTMINVEAGADVTDATNVNAAGAVMESDYNAHTVLQATSDNTPVPITIAEQQFVGRITSGNIKGLSIAEGVALLNVGPLDAANVWSADQILYDPVNDGNPQWQIGADTDEELHIQVIYDPGTQVVNFVQFNTQTAGAGANKGMYSYAVDSSPILDIDDGGINFVGGRGVSIDGDDIITDNGAGEATLSNIDVIDATTAATIKTAYESNSDTNAFEDADESKLDAIEASATADQSDAEIKTAYENNADTNEFSDAEQTKLAGIETSATADQTGAEIKSAYEGESNTNAFTDADESKLDAIEASADVTDATNVAAAGAPLLSSDNTFTGTNLNTAQPAFLVLLAGNMDNVTGDSTDVTIEWDTEVFDQDSNFDPVTTFAFTAPVAGRYLLCANADLKGFTAAADTVRLRLITSNRTYINIYTDNNDVGATQWSAITAVCDMDALDTATVDVRATGEASKVVDIVFTRSDFSGCLLV